MAVPLPSFGRYVVIRELGSGGMAKVYLARDPNLQRHVAIKAILTSRVEDRNVVKRFFMEAMTAARLKNPHIIEIYDFGDDGGVPYIVMEFINGPTLEEVILKHLPNPIPQEIAAALICQVAEGLDIAGQKGIVHRDIKPANLMITQQGYLKIMDFGIAHLKDLSITRTEGIIGPPAFMSPEQINGIKPLSIQSDMFALGVLFYFCLTGKHPFVAESYGDIFARVLNETPPSVCKVNPDVDPRLEKLVKTLIEKDPRKRGDGPKWLQRELQDFLHKRKVVGPVDRVSQFLIDMNSQGFATTRLSPSEIERAAKSFKGKTSKKLQGSTRRNPSRFGKVAVRTLIVLVGIGVLAAGAWYGRSSLMNLSNHLSQVKPESPVLDGQQRPERPLAVEPTPVAPAISSATEQALALPDFPSLTAKHPGTESGLRPLQHRKVQSQGNKPPQPVPVSTIETTSGECTLGMKTSPPFAEIYLDDKYLGTSPLGNTTVPCGRHRLKMKAPLGETLDTVVNFPGGNAQMRFSLAPATP